MEEIVVVGAGGHGKVIADILWQCGRQVLGFLDDGLAVGARVLDLPILGKTELIPEYAKRGCSFILAIGAQDVRQKLAAQYGVEYACAIHPRAVIGRDVRIGAGTVIMAGAIVNPGAVIGEHCILNTGCVVEHDNKIGDFAHICPRAVLAGGVVVGKGTQLGVGSVVRNNITIAAGCLVGAGAVVVRDIEKPGVYVGVPAKYR